MRANSVGLAFAVFLVAAAVPQAQRSGQAGGPSASAKAVTAGSNPTFELTVDSIMRGPDLVGYPQTGLRWSADSQKLYFEWRKPGEDKAATYVVGREGGSPRKLSDDEVKNAPPANG